MTSRILAFLVWICVMAPATEAALIDSGGRVMRSAEGFSNQRNPSGSRETQLVENRQVVAESIVAKPRVFEQRAVSPSGSGFWIYSAATELFYDLDEDGYYHYLRVRFDTDTVYADAYVYAELYLSWDGETWEQYFVTEDFSVQGSTSLDEYEVETEFVSGYPTGLYDILIEIYDADFGEFVDEFGPFQSSAFSILPIEDLEHDGFPPPVTVSNEHGGGGAVSWLWLAIMVTGLIASRRRIHLQRAR